MRNFYFLIFTSLFTLTVNAQETEAVEGEYKFNNNTECLTEIQRQNIKTEIAKNVELLKSKGKLSNNSNKQNPLVHPTFIWPVVKNPAAPYSNVWSISNHVDHNQNTPSLLQDWNCGTRTYDTASGYNHQGIDIFTWPFSWYQMENNQSWVVAAAPGIIVGKYDGNFDKNCSFNNGSWNGLYVQHADGSQAWYGHMKSGSLTSKNIGDTVSEGEFLGVIGSSGNSTGPHLHFEVYDSVNQLIDPYQGTCNASTIDSWWQVQKPYQDPKINAVLTHTAPPVFNTCPTTETTNLSNNFANGSVVVEIYLADQLPGTSGVLQLKRPDNTIATTRTANITTFYAASYWYWTFTGPVFNQSGTWTASFTYQGQTVNHNFNYGTLGIAENFDQKFTIYPNPVNEVLNIDIKEEVSIKQISIYDMVGKKVHAVTSQFDKIDVSALTNGVYMIHIDSENGNYINKFIKQ